jgi:hypothetical protein
VESLKGDQAFASQSVLIVDNDLGFVFWLGELLAEAGYPAVPALDCQQAVSHLKQFNVTVSVAIVNPGLEGVSRLLQTLGRANRHLRIVVVPDPGRHAPSGIPAYAVLEKPSGWESLSRQEWLRKIKKALAEAPPNAFEASTAG